MRPQDRRLTPQELRFAQERALIRIVDDDAGLRDALRFVLEVEGWRVADHPDGRSFLTADAPSEPGCAVLDIRMPGMTGIEIQHAMIERGIRLPVIFLTGHGDVDMAVAALQDGAVDFIQKPIDNERLLASIACAAYESARGAAGAARQSGATGFASAPDARAAGLTGREREIAGLIAAGRLNREIAERLGIAVRTVEVHRANILRKRGVRTPEEIRSALGEC